MTAFCSSPVPGADFHIYGEVFAWNPASEHPEFSATWVDTNGHYWWADDYEFLRESIETKAKYDAMSDAEFDAYHEAKLPPLPAKKARSR